MPERLPAVRLIVGSAPKLLPPPDDDLVVLAEIWPAAEEVETEDVVLEVEIREFVVARRRRAGTLKIPEEETVVEVVVPEDVVAKAWRPAVVERLEEELRFREMRSIMDSF